MSRCLLPHSWPASRVRVCENSRFTGAFCVAAARLWTCRFYASADRFIECGTVGAGDKTTTCFCRLLADTSHQLGSSLRKSENSFLRVRNRFGRLVFLGSPLHCTYAIRVLSAKVGVVCLQRCLLREQSDLRLAIVSKLPLCCVCLDSPILHLFSATERPTLRKQARHVRQQMRLLWQRTHYEPLLAMLQRVPRPKSRQSS